MSLNLFVSLALLGKKDLAPVLDYSELIDNDGFIFLDYYKAFDTDTLEHTFLFQAL